MDKEEVRLLIQAYKDACATGDVLHSLEEQGYDWELVLRAPGARQGLRVAYSVERGWTATPVTCTAEH